MNETQTTPPASGILTTLKNLSMRQKIIAGAATAGVIILCALMVMISGREKMALLFSGLDSTAAGEIAMQLDGMSVPYTVSGSAIMVPENQRDRLRIEMARIGLPADTGSGYELLDSLNGFSTTSDMFDAAYWRAKEGELTRTISSMPAIRSARVHLGVTRNTAFRRAQDSKSASVTIEAPIALTREQATSIQFLTALAVPELRPENVAVIDTQRGVIAGPGGKTNELDSSDTFAREQAISIRLQNMLEAHVGRGNAEVTVALEVDQTRVAQTERLVDPNSRQIATRNILEERDTEANGQGVVTIASNLPDGDAIETDPNAPILRTKRDEEVVYTGTEIERVTQQMPGAVSRLSIAVLINERYILGENGESQLDPRSPEELTALEALVASAAGIDENRGDQLTVQVLPFDTTPPEEISGPGFVNQYVMPRAMDLIQIFLLGAFAITLVLFILKPMINPKHLPPQLLEAGDNGLEEAETVDPAQLLTMLTKENPEDAAALLEEWFEEEPETT